MEVLTRYGIRASAALNSEVCDHHPEIIEAAGRHSWELIGHNQTNALRLTEMDAAEERDAVQATIDRIEAASGKRPVGWLGPGLAETWNTLDYLYSLSLARAILSPSHWAMATGYQAVVTSRNPFACSTLASGPGAYDARYPEGSASLFVPALWRP